MPPIRLTLPRSRHPDRPLSDTLHLWRRARKEAGLDGVRLHDLGHSVASQAVRLHLLHRCKGHR